MLALAGATLPGTGVAHASDLIVGACYLEIELTFTAALVAAPDEVEVGLGGGGTCHVLDPDLGTVAATVDGDLHPPVAAPNFGCAGGVAVGTVNLLLPNDTFSGEAVLVATPVTAVMVLASEDAPPPQFVAAGAYVHVPGLPDALCARDGLGSTSWIGVLAFEDPELG